MKKHNTSETIKRASDFPLIMIGEGLLVGIFAGFLVLLYRISLTYASGWMNQILSYAKGHPFRIAGWFVVLFCMAVIVGLLVKWEPMISGSGIPQLEGEMTGKLTQKWYKIIPAKFVGGFLCLQAGLALGREGPSIQLGAMMGKGISRFLKRGKTEEKFLLTCGASAGMAAAFQAPLAGVMFAMEEIHKNFSAAVFISAMTASVAADYITSQALGMKPVFEFEIASNLPQKYYIFLIALGIILGVMGVFYNWFTLKVQWIYKKIPFPGTISKVMVPFGIAGILGFTVPEILGNGHSLIDQMTHEKMVFGTLLMLFILRFLFSAVSFGAGVPGGIFFPMLVLGAFVGCIFGYVCTDLFGIPEIFINNFVLLSMAGYFTAVVRAPMTGIILIFELTGSLSQMLSLSVVTIVSYLTAMLLKSEPIYESLLERILEGMHVETEKDGGEKVLDYYAVTEDSAVSGKQIRDILWPEHCLLVAVKRGEKELIPKGRTRIMTGDIIITMTDEEHNGEVYDKMRRLCRKE
ncbi:ClC family H(+)/Cl(-) exchange transporter [Sellimonas sp.]|uniref:ClC family H(+)/Cl(-) exchange transporter n=1 Tax=Sellimonas sp. TaxID=2021466 RepID=UPI000B3AB2D0|nr:ClC family H(+)/Cl(-) exchange transporter [Sellimonas sp.]OUP01778.1 ClC family H(+)/Cl(-) exchange transporter [Drancourtella sp. An210]